jgi:hypothetical protein
MNSTVYINQLSVGMSRLEADSRTMHFPYEEICTDDCGKIVSIQGSFVSLNRTACPGEGDLGLASPNATIPKLLAHFGQPDIWRTPSSLSPGLLIFYAFDLMVHYDYHDCESKHTITVTYTSPVPVSANTDYELPREKLWR